MRPRVLNCLGCYWPGNEATGPNQSFRALASGLRDSYRFKVVSGSPIGSGESARSCSAWSDDGYAMVKRCPPGRLSARHIRRILCDTDYELLLLNSFFDREFTIAILIMRKLGLIPRRPTILSPRGEFAPGALSIKPRRKRAYIALARQLGLLDDVWLHATADHEAADMERLNLGERAILRAPDPAQLFDPPQFSAQTAGDHRLRIAFVGRLTPVKNLNFALDVLSKTSVPNDFDIYGPVGDRHYWEACQKRIADMPKRVRIGVKGTIPNSQIPETLARYDLFFLPTLGENFGQAIHEALACGLPALISDRTPWRGLAGQEAGWDLPLDAPQHFVEKIDALASMDENERLRLRVGARRFAERRHAESDAIGKHRSMFEKAIAASAKPCNVSRRDSTAG